MSEVSICNAALSKLGSATILSLTEDSNRARVMNLRYAEVRDAEFHRRRWRFTIKRASLPALTEAPGSDFDFQYQVPVDYIRLIEGGDIRSVVDLANFRGGGNALFSVEGDRILTDLGAPLLVRYIARITDTALFNPSFKEALSSRLAYECCERITQSDSKKDACLVDYRLAVGEAKRANAIEVGNESQADAEWVMARAS